MCFLSAHMRPFLDQVVERRVEQEGKCWGLGKHGEAF